MRYISTRGAAPELDFDDVLLAGLARDGGLYVPKEWPRFTDAEIREMRGMGYADLAVRNEVVVRRGDVLGFLPDDIHSVQNEGASASLSLHIYGKSLAHIDRSEFDPEQKIQRPCPKRVRNRAD